MRILAVTVYYAISLAHLPLMVTTNRPLRGQNGA